MGSRMGLPLIAAPQAYHGPCRPPRRPVDEEFAALFAPVGATLIPLGPSRWSVAAGLKAPSADAGFRLAAELSAARRCPISASIQAGRPGAATGRGSSGSRRLEMTEEARRRLDVQPSAELLERRERGATLPDGLDAVPERRGDARDPHPAPGRLVGCPS
jgi:hypothetical protein